ncbi:MAG: hypothetical protein RLZZ630_702 [Bacteroidota bacterium]|jgi:uncharacterized protein (TIGR00661 family)
MKILYAIQGTGNGHLSRSLEIIPRLQKEHHVDVLLSSSQWELKVPFPIRYRYKGLGFVFGKKGGVDILRTYLELDTKKLLKEIKSLPVEEYDLVISDFEPVSVWACRLRNKVSVGLSNQAATLHPLAPKPEQKDRFGKSVLKHYAKASFNYGFHFRSLSDDVYTPVIRKKVRKAEKTNRGHITVYLPAFDDFKVMEKLSGFKKVPFQIFSKRAKCTLRNRNFTVFPLQDELFTQSMSESDGVLTQAGFGTTSEALYLGKKLMVIPMKTQYEQQCNAAMLGNMGVDVIRNLKKESITQLEDWLVSGKPCEVDYPDQTDRILHKIIGRHAGQAMESPFQDIGWDDMVQQLFIPQIEQWRAPR